MYISGSFTITSHSPEEGHPSPKVLGKYCFAQKLLTGQLSTAHGYPSASPTKRDNTPFKKTARSEAVVAEVPASRSGRKRRQNPLRGVAHIRGPAPFRGSAPIPTSFFILLVQSPDLRRAHVGIMHAHAHAENLHVRARTRKWRRSVSAVEEPHDLPYECTAREKRTLGVRAHFRRLWRRLVKKSAPRLVLVRR